MLRIETTSNGRTVVRLQKDWTPSRIGRAYTPRPQMYDHTRDLTRLQTVLLKEKTHETR
jgi:hypothetical protein